MRLPAALEVSGLNPPRTFNCEMHKAEITNDSALNANATLKPYPAPTAPRNAPAVRLAQDVVCVIVFAVCSSSGVAIPGRIELRPAVKKGDANINAALSR